MISITALLRAACLGLLVSVSARAAVPGHSCVERMGRNAQNSPYILGHGHRTPYAIVLIHGFSDSPYFTRALGQIFYDHGWNVVGILLSGHGTAASDLIHVNLGDWEKDTACGYRVASELGDHVAMGGFSTGAALSIEAALTPGEFSPVGLFLFSPALDFHNWMANYSCLLKRFRTYDTNVAENSDVRYRRKALNGVCELKRLMDKIGHADRAGEIKVPALVVFSAADLTVRHEATERFVSGLKPPHDAIEFPISDHIAHSDVVRPEGNPRFPDLVRAVNGFIDEHFPASR
jgi:esterase/lipase